MPSNAVLEDVILLEVNSTITGENLEYAKEIIDERAFVTVSIVSDPLHMKRAMLIVKDYQICAYTSPTPTTMHKSFKTKLSFLMREVLLYISYVVVRLFRQFTYRGSVWIN